MQSMTASRRGPVGSRSGRGRTLASLAFLKVNGDRGQGDYLDNFVPLVCEALLVSPSETVSLGDLQCDIEAGFGIRLPQHALAGLLKRVRRAGYLTVDHGVYHKVRQRLEQTNYAVVRQQVLVECETLTQHLKDFLQERGETRSLEEAERALLAFLHKHQLSLMYATAAGTVIPPVKESDEYFVADFIRGSQGNGSADLGRIELLLKGTMLANAIFLPDPSAANRTFRNTTVFLDTPFLIRALGYSGEARCGPCRDLLELLYETGARLQCFRDTVEEVRGALSSCAGRMRQGHRQMAYSPAAETVDHFLTKGYSASDVELLVERLEESLAVLRIAVVDRPDFTDHRFVIHEQDLDDTLARHLNYRRAEARTHDVNAVAAIMRLRKGRHHRAVEDCGAVFVTSNPALARVTRLYFGRRRPRDEIAPCITDYTLTNLLWLKRPTAAPDLPRKRVLADCFAAVQPNEALWRAYVIEVQRLEEDGTITADQYYLLRYSQAAKAALMELTAGRQDVFAEGTVPEILQRIETSIAAAERNRLLDEKRRREAAEAELEAGRAREEGRRHRLRLRARSQARWVLAAPAALLFAVLTYGFLATLPGLHSESHASLGLFVADLAVVIFSLLDVLLGTNLRRLVRALEPRVEEWLYRRGARILD